MNEERIFQELQARMKCVKDYAGIPAHDPFDLVLDTVLDSSEAMLRAAYRSRRSNEAIVVSLENAIAEISSIAVQLERSAFADFDSRLKQLETKIGHVERKIDAAGRLRRRDENVAQRLRTITLVVCIATLMAVVGVGIEGGAQGCSTITQPESGVSPPSLN